MKTQNIEGALFGSGPCYFKQPGLGGTKPAVVSHTLKNHVKKTKNSNQTAGLTMCTFLWPDTRTLQNKVASLHRQGEEEKACMSRRYLQLVSVCTGEIRRRGLVCLHVLAGTQLHFFTCCIHNDRQCLGNACAWKAFSLPFAEKAFLLSLEKRALLIHPENNFSATRPHINKHGPTSTSTQSTFPVPLSQSAGRAARQRKICRNKGQVCHFLTPPSPPPLVRGRIIRKCES